MKKLKKEQLIRELKSNILAEKAARSLQPAYRQAQLDIIEALQVAVEDYAVNVTLWNAVEKIEFDRIVDEALSAVTKTSQEVIGASLLGVTKLVESIHPKTFRAHLGAASPFQREAIINAKFHGKTFSERIWGNNQTVGSQIKEGVERLIQTEATPQDISRAIQRDLDVSYGNARRLVVTESNRVLNEASIAQYKAMGVTEVEYLAENDSCEVCGDNDGVKFKLGFEPTLPAHPYCRCTYLPVIES